MGFESRYATVAGNSVSLTNELQTYSATMNTVLFILDGKVNILKGFCINPGSQGQLSPQGILPYAKSISMSVYIESLLSKINFYHDDNTLSPLYYFV